MRIVTSLEKIGTQGCKSVRKFLRGLTPQSERQKVMAMKRKPKQEEPGIDLISGGLLSTVTTHQRNVLATSVRDALRRTPRSIQNRCDPFTGSKTKPKVKWKNRSKEKDMVSCNLPKTIPVLKTADKTTTPIPNGGWMTEYHAKKSITSDDSELHAMWWDFHDDRSLRMKTLPIDISNKDKLERIRSSQLSQESKATLNIVKAMGITPRSQKHGPKLVGTAPHQASPEFSDVILNNPVYKQELIDRYVEGLSMNDLQITFPILNGAPMYHDPINSTTTVSYEHSVDSVSLAGDDTDLEALIAALEVHIEVDTDAQPIVLAGPVTPLAAPSVPPTLVERETQYEQEQWTAQWPINPNRIYSVEEWTPDHQDMYDTMVSLRGQYKGTAAAKSLVNVKRIAAQRDEGGFAYQHWLIKNRSSINLRTRVELSKQRVNPEHTLNLGVSVHPLFHVGGDKFEMNTRFYQHRNLAMHEMGVLESKAMGEWYEHTDKIIARIETDKAEARMALLNLNAGKIIEQAHKEELVDKIVDDVITKQESKSQLGFKQWNYMIASQYTTETTQATTVREDSPLVDQPTAEVVDLSLIRNKRASGIGSLLHGFNFDISSLSKEEKEGARKLLDYMSKQLG